MNQDLDSDLSRRSVVVLGAGLVAGAGGLAACSSSASTATVPASGAAAAAPPATSAGPAAGGSSGSAGGAKGGALDTLAAVPVGTAVSAKDADGKPIIIAQPTAGTVVAFSAICTHMGCTVAPVAGTTKLLCPCHGSTYDGTTGKNTGGPAPQPLTAIPVTVSGDSIVAG